MNRNDAKKTKMFLFRSFIKTFLGIHHTLTLSICPYISSAFHEKQPRTPTLGDASPYQHISKLAISPSRTFMMIHQPTPREKETVVFQGFFFALQILTGQT